MYRFGEDCVSEYQTFTRVDAQKVAVERLKVRPSQRQLSIFQIKIKKWGLKCEWKLPKCLP